MSISEQARLRERIDECLRPLWDYDDLHHGIFVFGSDGTLLGFTPLRTIFQATQQRVRLTQIRRQVVALANVVFETVGHVKGEDWVEHFGVLYDLEDKNRRDRAVIFPLHGGSVLITIADGAAKLSLPSVQFGQLLSETAKRLTVILREG